MTIFHRVEVNDHISVAHVIQLFTPKHGSISFTNAIVQHMEGFQTGLGVLNK